MASSFIDNYIDDLSAETKNKDKLAWHILLFTVAHWLENGQSTKSSYYDNT